MTTPLLLLALALSSPASSQGTSNETQGQRDPEVIKVDTKGSKILDKAKDNDYSPSKMTDEQYHKLITADGHLDTEENLHKTLSTVLGADKAGLGPNDRTGGKLDLHANDDVSGLKTTVDQDHQDPQVQPPVPGPGTGGHAMDGALISLGNGLGLPSPPQSTPDHPVTPQMLQTYRDNLQTVLQDQEAQAERSGDNGRAALLSAYASKPEQAARLAQNALGADPGNKQALTALMVARRQQGRADEARALAQKALAADPDNALAKIIAGHSGSLDKGDALQKKVAKMDLGKTAETGGLTGGLMGLFGGGRKDADEASRGAGAQFAGGAGQTGGVSKPAAPVYDVTQPLTPAQQLVLRAVRKHEIGDEQGAMLALTEAIDRDPRDAGAFVVRAEVDNSLLKYAEAVIDATKAVDLAPTKPVLTARALRARAYANLELKQWVQALADASRAVDQDPQSGLGFLYRAMAEDKLGRGNAASDDLKLAVKLDPSLTPLAKPLLQKYGLTSAPASSGGRGRAVALVFVGAAALLLAAGSRKLFTSRRQRLTTTAAKRLMESTPVP